ALAEFAARVAHALRLGARARDVSLELERTRALLSVVGEAISHLSLAHTLETAVEGISSLLALDRVGIYLRYERHRLSAAPPSVRCSRRSPDSSPSQCRTRVCTKRRRSSAKRSAPCSRRSVRPRGGSARSTRSRTRSPAASRSNGRCSR